MKYRMLMMGIVFIALFIPVMAAMRRIVPWICGVFRESGRESVRRLMNERKRIARDAVNRAASAEREKEEAEKIRKELEDGK